MENNSSHRLVYWDNAKAILITLVVIGHFLLPVAPKEKIVFSAYAWIYLFHMPAFVFVSGYFSRRYVEKGASDIQKLIGFLVLYILFQIAIWIIKIACEHDVSMLFIFTPSGAPWYLMCMFLWYCLIPHCAKIRPIIMIPLSVLAGLLVGFEWKASDFLALSRCFVFFPFFIIGYHFNYDWIAKAKPVLRIASAALLITAFIIIWLFRGFFANHVDVLYGHGPYSSSVLGLIERFIWYIIAGVLVLAFLCVVPSKEYFFTYIGQRTLAIYIIHRLIRDLCDYLGFYKILSSDLLTFIVCLTISVIITLMLSPKWLTDLFNRAFSAKYRLLLKERN